MSDDIGNLLRDVIGRLEKLEDSTPSTRRARSDVSTGSIARNCDRQQYQNTDHEMPGPSYTASTCTFNRRRFYPYTSERNRVFRPSSHRQNMSHPSAKSKKVEKWRHEFVCLANKGQSRAPLPMEKVELVHAKLGPLHLELTLNGDSQMFHDELLKGYPKLQGCGGYELLRGSDTNNRELTVIAPPVGGYTALFLKSVVSHAKIYVRPLQADLSLYSNISESAVSKIVSL